MFARGKSKERTSNRKVTPPSPSYMSNDQFASYLADLRQNRISRPGGARPQPENVRRDSGRPSLANSKRSSLGGASVVSDTSSMNQRGKYPVPPSIVSRQSVAGSVTSRYSNSSARGRDYYPKTPGSTAPLKPSDVVPSATYIERGQRWMEKEEAFSLKQAMDDMDLKEREKSTPVEVDEDEKRIHAAALDEAADLVWQHQNGVKPPEPDAPYRYKPHMRKNSYAYARTASAGYNGADVEPTGLRRDMGSRSVSGSSTSSDGNNPSRSRVSLGSTAGKSGGRPSLEKSRENSMDSDEPSKAYRGLASGPRPMAMKSSDRRRSSLKRNISGEVQKPFSGDQIWEEPEGTSSPAAKATSSKAAPENVQPLRAKAKNPLNRVQFAAEVPETDPKLPEAPPRPVSKIEIHRNPPSQSRNPLYTSSSSSETPAAPREEVPRKNGVEIRGDDIRSATSMKLKDRSEKLPTPAFVSDSPGRPIVSFDATWKVPEKDPGTDKKPDPRHRSPFFRRDQAAKQQSPASTPGTASWPRPQPQPAALRQASSVPVISVVEDRDLPRPQSTPQQPRSRSVCPPPAIQVESVADERPFAAAAAAAPATVPSIAVSQPESFSKTPSVPSISVAAPPAIPSIVTPDDNDDDGAPSVPIIIAPDEASSNSSSNSKPTTPSARPLPTPVKGPVGRFRHEAQRSRGHWSPAPGSSAGSRATARCHECRQYIEGRFVALAGGNERFHPQCFTCYTCGTSLEALEISPEPDSFRAARLERIARREAGETLDEEPGQTMAEDGDERLRFFCHLDWHEQFAPKCKHCRTPIIGEHVVALGSHWHYGHFFCAECGDPFEQGMTHIEKDGYAWCVNCQTKRTERRAPKCKGCKKAVIGQYVRALGGEWHDECFRCGTCGGGFDDGQVFPREASDGFMEVLCKPCRARELKG